MRVTRIQINNFRGIKEGVLLLPGHVVLVGDNNSGKSTILEAIDLVLGPERLARRPVIDEHDFYGGIYVDEAGLPVEMKIEVVVVGLTEEQQRQFRNHIEWWNETSQNLLEGPPAEGTDAEGVLPALRVFFTGTYDVEEDDFLGNTYFASPTLENGNHDIFRITDKRQCGFLFLRTVRTGSRALSLERGSLLDIILRLKEKRLQMWENVLGELRRLPVAEQPELGITEILSEVQKAISSYVPSEWGENPHIRVSDLTRENLRKVLTVFMETGAKKTDGSNYSAPFQHQGTGTINVLVLALLSLIAENRQNVIFAMEEPEIAIPPHTQKRIIDSVRKISSQAIFTSHSPYVLEDFEPDEIIVIGRKAGVLSGIQAEMPPAVKAKSYRMAMRTKFCEGLLAGRVLIVEGRTEVDAIPAVARRLSEIAPERFKTLESLGIAIVNAESDTQVAPLGTYFKNLGKTVFAVFDKQEPAVKASIQSIIPNSFEAPERGLEDTVLKGVAESALRRHALELVRQGEWPSHLTQKTPTSSMTLDLLRDAMKDYLGWSKGSGTVADLLGGCNIDEMPAFILDTLSEIQRIVEPPVTSLEPDAEADNPVPTEVVPQ